MLPRPWIKPASAQAVATEIAQARRARASSCRTSSASWPPAAASITCQRSRRRTAALVDDELGRVRAEVRTAVALTADEKRQLAARLEQRARQAASSLEETVDSTLLGGFIAQVGSLILDGSLDGQLARMRERLARG